MKKTFTFLLLLLFIFPLFVFAQENKTINNQATTTALEKQTGTSSFFKDLDVPKIIKNNVRITKTQITKAEINANNEIVIEGTVELKNNSDTKTSNLFVSSFTGIKGSGYYLQYPLYTDSRSDAFILEPRQVVTKEFKIVERNFSQYGNPAVEVWLIDEYNNRVHAGVSLIPQDIFPSQTIVGKVFDDFTTKWVISGKEFPLNSAPTFYAETDNLALNIDFKKTDPTFLGDVYIKIFDQKLFTTPIKEFSQKLVRVTEGSNQFVIEMPKDLKPGVYPIEVRLMSNDESLFLPRIYSRFIVGGNMSKVIDVSLISKSKKVEGITFVVQGNAIDIVNPEKKEGMSFGAEVFVYDKNDTLLSSQKIENQSVSIFRNIEVGFDEPLKERKISKIKIELSDDTGIFDIYTKEFTHEKNFTFLNILFGVISLLIIGLVIVLRKKRLVGVLPLLLFCLFTQSVDAGMTPTPYKHFGILEYDAFDSDPYSNLQYNCPSGCGGLDGIDPVLYNNDSDIMRYEEDLLLDTYGAILSFDQPVFHDDDPTFCYAPGQLIPVVFNYSSDTLLHTASEPVKVNLSFNTQDWFFNLRNWSINNLNDVSNPDYYNSPMANLAPPDFKQFDLDYIYDHVTDLIAQSAQDWVPPDGSPPSVYEPELPLLNMNASNIWEIQQKMVHPTNSWSSDTAMESNSYSYEYSLVAPEKPGIYNFISSLYFDVGPNEGEYVSQHRIKVCDSPHDADYLMSGKQYVDSDGNLRDEGGTLMSGYTVQGYPIESGVIPSGNINELTDEDGYPTGQYDDGGPDGFNDDSYNDFNFITVANYCGYKDPSYESTYGPDFATNRWVNYFSNASDLLQKSGWNNVWNFVNHFQQADTRIPVFAFRSDSTKYYPSSNKTYPVTVSLQEGDEYNFIVHKEGDEFKFIDLTNPLLPSNYSKSFWSTSIDKVLRLENLGTIPKLSFSDLLSGGKFNYPLFGSSPKYISATENNTSNTFLIKENLSGGGTCSLYEDFCVDKTGVQYLLENGSYIDLWSIDSSGNHTFASSTLSSSLKTKVEGMCAAVVITPTSSLSGTCIVESPVQESDRNPNTQIMFHAVASNSNPSFPTTYAWTGASAMSDTTYSTTTYTTTGGKTDVSVQITNGTSTASVSCPVTIVGAAINAMCSGNTVTLNNSSTYEAQPSGGIYQWKEENGVDIPGATSQTYSINHGVVGSHWLRVQITKNSVTEVSGLCSANVTPVNSCVTPQPNECFQNRKYTWACPVDTWIKTLIPGSELCENPPTVTTENPQINKFKFSPNIISLESDLCELTLEATGVSSCVLYKGKDVDPATTQINALIGGNIISTSGNIGVGVGSYRIGCTANIVEGIEPLSRLSDVQKCILNPSVQEN